jgi:hypothetical protein
MTKHPKETERLKKIVEQFPKVTVTVVGDLVADEFVFGEISRVSREAPVLILKHRERTIMPGGGANAINNLADLGVNVLPVGVLGDDEAGRLLLKAFRSKHIPVSGILKDKSYTTVTKTRILAGMTHTARQQVVRIDREPEMEPSRHLKRELVLAARQYARASDALMITATERRVPRSSMRSGNEDVWMGFPWCSIPAIACCNILVWLPLHPMSRRSKRRWVCGSATIGRDCAPLASR